MKSTLQLRPLFLIPLFAWALAAQARTRPPEIKNENFLEITNHMLRAASTSLSSSTSITDPCASETSTPCNTFMKMNSVERPEYQPPSSLKPPPGPIPHLDSSNVVDNKLSQHVIFAVADVEELPYLAADMEE